jgi:hypothetical protein
MIILLSSINASAQPIRWAGWTPASLAAWGQSSSTQLFLHDNTVNQHPTHYPLVPGNWHSTNSSVAVCYQTQNLCP